MHELPAIGGALEAVAVAASRHEVADEVWKQFTDFAPEQGWVGFQSANRWFRNGQPPTRSDETGELLNAEVVNSNGASLHIRFVGPHWIATTYTPAQGGIEYVVDERVHVGVPGVDSLRYRRYWMLGGGQGAYIAHSRFIGFGPMQNGHAQ